MLLRVLNNLFYVTSVAKVRKEDEEKRKVNYLPFFVEDA